MKNSANTSSLQQSVHQRARKAGLVYINEFEKGYARHRRGKGFSYLSTAGSTIKSDRTRNRISALAIPPAWTDVWICPQTNGHIQAVGRDADGRKQYIYHERWQAISNATKFDRMALVAQLLPRIRRRVRKDLNSSDLSKQRVLAAIVRLLDKAHIRVGNQRYTKNHGSRGATTLSGKNVDVDGVVVSLDFKGKSGQKREIEFSDEKIARLIEQCEEIDGQFLFCYQDEDEAYEPIVSTDVNEYLREITEESLTAKDFRTWSGSVIALSILSGKTDKQSTEGVRKKLIAESVAAAAKALGNSNAVCRNSYIHPGILVAFEAGTLDSIISKTANLDREKRVPELTVHESVFARILPKLNS